MVFCAHRAQQLVLEVGVVDHMVLRELRGLAIAHQVAAGVAHMRQRVRLAAQHQGGERGQAHGRLAAPVDATQPGVLRSDDAVQRHGGVPGLGRAKVIAHHTGCRGLRRLAAHAAGAHAVRNGHNGAHVFLPLCGQHGGTKVFVKRFAPSLGCKANVYVKSHAPRQAISMPIVKHCTKVVRVNPWLTLRPSAFACCARSEPRAARTGPAGFRCQ